MEATAKTVELWGSEKMHLPNLAGASF